MVPDEKSVRHAVVRIPYGTYTRCPPTTQTNISDSSFPFARFYLFIHMVNSFLTNIYNNPQRDPNAHYIFDSERDASQSEICRQSKKNKECMILQMTSRELFAAMQVRVSHLSFTLHGPPPQRVASLYLSILSPWCHGIDSDRVVVV